MSWSYEGSNGPEHWAKLKPELAACGSGKRQSPIDIQDGAHLDLEPVKFDDRLAPLRIIDNGHTVQINYAEGSSILVSGVRQALQNERASGAAGQWPPDQGNVVIRRW